MSRASQPRLLINPARSGRLARFLALAIVASICAFSSPALAEEPDDVDAYYEAGMEHFYRSEYSLAIANFRRAYALEPHGIFQYNISVSAARLGNLNDAVEAAQQALELGGLPEDVERRLRGQLRSYQVAIRALDVAGEISKARADEEEVPVEEDEREASSVAAIETPQETSEGGLGFTGWTGVGLASVGFAGLVTAGVLHLGLDGQIEDYDRAREQGDAERTLQLHDQISTTQQRGKWITYGAGSAFVLGMGLLTFDLLRGDEEVASGRLQFQTTTSSVSIDLRWDF